MRDVYRVHRVGDTGVVALAGVHLAIERGEFVALLGPSGSGKSSILNLLGGLDRASAGTVAIDGDDIGLLSDAERTRLRAEQVGFVWQGAVHNLMPYLSVIDNVRLPRSIGGRWGGLRRRRARDGNADQLLEAVGLRARRDHRPPELSGGEQQRVAIAIALANDPGLLLIDEPTAELDAVSAARVLDACRVVSDVNGVTVVMSTHDVLAAERADRTVHVRLGRVLIRGAPIPRVDEHGRVRLPNEAVAALGDGELETLVDEHEVRLRPQRGRRG
jgi:ABC-type lipoprotein export system ATPase subunit